MTSAPPPTSHSPKALPMSSNTTEKNMDLNELADRVEGLSGPDAEVDALIRCALFAGSGAYVKQSPINGSWCIYELGYGGKERNWEPRGLSQEHRLGSFTESIDAAMALVPDRLRLMLSEWDDEKHLRARGPWQAVLSEPGADASFDLMRGYRCEHGASPAIALTVAALRARSQATSQ